MTLPSKEQFTEYLDSTFVVRLEDGQNFNLQLFRLDSSTSNKMQESFSLLFRAPLDTPPFQNTFHIEQEKLGDMELFLVPVEKKDDCLVFEAIVNRLLV